MIDLLGALNLSPAQAPEGGLSIVARGPTPSLIAQGRITDAATGFSAPLHFPDLSFHRATGLHTNGVPLGAPSTDSPYAGTGIYTPHIIARNLTGSRQSIVPTLEYPGASGPVQAALAPLTLAPYATMDIPLDAALALVTTPIPHASIGIQYSGAAGSVIAEVASIEQRGGLAVSSYVENAGNNFAGSGAHAWHLDAQTESILYLSNLGNQECPIGLRVEANGAPYYVTDVRLKAHETRAISLRQLRDAQKTDFQGHKVPADATDGSVLWARLKNLPVTGTLDVVTNGELVTPEPSISCCCPANYQGLSVTPQGSTMLVGAQLQFKATLATMDCNGLYYYFDWTDGVLWSSSATTVATVNNSTSPGLVTAVGVGTTSVIGNGGEWQQYMCCAGVCNACAQVPVEGGTGLTVAPAPNHVSVVVDQEGFPAACPTTGIYVRQMQMQVVDVNNNAIVANANIAESFPNQTTNTCGTGQPNPSSCALTGNVGGVGEFLDTMSVSGNFCGSGIVQGSGCGFSLTSKWAACASSGSNTLWTSPRVVDSNEIEVNGSWNIFARGTQFH